jgi:ribosome maturation protein Sdo1
MITTMKKGLFLFLLTMLNAAVRSQTSKPINDTLNYKVIYGLAVKGEVASVLSLFAAFKPVRFYPEK